MRIATGDVVRRRCERRRQVDAPRQRGTSEAGGFPLLDAYGAAEVSLLVPDIFWAECGNIIWKAVRHHRLSRLDGEVAILSMMRRSIPTISSASLLSEALPIAFNFERSVYECLYVALAVQSETHLITADERLANALAARFPVKWLGMF